MSYANPLGSSNRVLPATEGQPKVGEPSLSDRISQVSQEQISGNPTVEMSSRGRNWQQLSSDEEENPAPKKEGASLVLQDSSLQQGRRKRGAEQADLLNEAPSSLEEGNETSVKRVNGDPSSSSEAPHAPPASNPLELVALITDVSRVAYGASSELPEVFAVLKTRLLKEPLVGDLKVTQPELWGQFQLRHAQAIHCSAQGKKDMLEEACTLATDAVSCLDKNAFLRADAEDLLQRMQVTLINAAQQEHSTKLPSNAVTHLKFWFEEIQRLSSGPNKLNLNNPEARDLTINMWKSVKKVAEQALQVRVLNPACSSSSSPAPAQRPPHGSGGAQQVQPSARTFPSPSPVSNSSGASFPTSGDYHHQFVQLRQQVEQLRRQSILGSSSNPPQPLPKQNQNG